MRFIKPSKKFYNMLMSVWVNMDIESLNKLKFAQYLARVKTRVGDMKWSDNFISAVRQFYAVATDEYNSL